MLCTFTFFNKKKIKKIYKTGKVKIKSLLFKTKQKNSLLTMQ